MAASLAPGSTNRLSDFIVLPLSLPLPPTKRAKGLSAPTHYIYIREHESRGDDVILNPALFVSNLPIDATETGIKSFFNRLCAGRGRVLRTVLQSESCQGGLNGFSSLADIVREQNQAEGGGIDDDSSDGESRSAFAGTKRKLADFADNSVATVAAAAPKSKKIRRIVGTAQMEEDRLLEKLRDTVLPDSWDGLSKPLPSGSCAIIYFIDKPSLASCLKACRRAAKREARGSSSDALVWEVPSDFATGRARYAAHHAACFPDITAVRSSVNAYLTVFSKLEKHRQTVQAQLANQPDEDGFVTVTKATRAAVSVADAQAAQSREAKRREKTKIGNSFYRFQVRERLKEQDRMLRDGFADDVRRLQDSRTRQ